MTRVLVTGGAGAIGAHLVRRLLDDGDEVVVLDDLSSGRSEDVPSGAQLVIGSVAVEGDLDLAFADRPQRVFHLAALFANQNSVDHPLEDLLANGRGTLAVLERAAGTAEKVLVCSSSCVYGPGPFDDSVEVPLPVETPYAITKALGEGYARYFARQHGLDTVIVRPFNVYGPGERPGRYRNVVPNFIGTALAGQPLVITGTGDETRDFTFVSDAVRAMQAAMAGATTPGDVFNIATGRETSIRELAESINRLTGNSAGITYRERRSWDDVSRRVGSVDRAIRLLGFEATVGIEDGLAATVDWFRRLDG